MFITIDGPDGTGKTTLARQLADRLQAAGIPAAYTCEPTDSALGQHIREILREGGYELSRLTDLFVEDRAEHIRDFIRPRCRRGDVVICDRYKYSTLCYQHLQGEPIARLLALNAGFLAPDLPVILLAEDADLLLERINRRGQGSDLFESRRIIQRSIEIYRQMPCYFPEEDFLYLNAALSPEETAGQLETKILEMLGKVKEG